MNKPNYNEIIKSARKAKGLTQQELADQAGVSLRTVQRIEKGTEEISGFSIRQITTVLNIPLENLIMQNVDQLSVDSNQIGSVKKLYLTSLTFILNPIFGVIVPTIIGASKQNKSDFYKREFKRLLLIQGIPLLLFCVWILLFTLCAIFDIPSHLFNFDSMYIFLFPIIYFPAMLAVVIMNIIRLSRLK